MQAFRKLLLLMSLLFGSAIAFFFESCPICTILRFNLLLLILIPLKYEKTAVVLEVVGFILSLFLVITQNPLFCESGCSTLLMSLPLSSLIVFFMLFVIRYAKLDQTKKEQIAVAIQELNKPQKKED